MAKGRRRPRPVRGDYGRILRGILIEQRLDAEDPDGAKLSHDQWLAAAGLDVFKFSRELGRAYAAQLDDLRSIGCPYVGKMMYERGGQCRSSLTTNTKRETCRQQWMCPFCYSRKVLEVWKRIKQVGFRVKLDFYADSMPREAVAAYAATIPAQVSELCDFGVAPYLGQIVWDWVEPATDYAEQSFFVHWVSVSMTIWEQDPRVVEADFLRAFAYDHAWLHASPAAVSFALGYTKTGGYHRRITGRLRNDAK